MPLGGSRLSVACDAADIIILSCQCLHRPTAQHTLRIWETRSATADRSRDLTV